MALDYNKNDKQVNVDGTLFAVIDGVLHRRSLEVKNDHLISRWHIARMLNGCKLSQMIKAKKLLT